ncbi:hypothetical protein ACIQ4I_16500 [Rummeliibacillus sp. NPDC094406]|uniref:hypothetical protein n=1 Tax=Rummeliibacillus sp. NPDC094406 TaxID=3364511 RepID=UPI00381ED85F
MSKRRNLLSQEELHIATKNIFVAPDEEAIKLFYEDCKLRNLRPHTFKYYHESLNIWLPDI